VGATGLLKGKGIPYQWANQTWFYPDSTVQAGPFAQDLAAFAGIRQDPPTGSTLTIQQAIQYASAACQAMQQAPLHKIAAQPTAFLQTVKQAWSSWGLQDFHEQRPITKKELAVLLDKSLDPFASRGVDHSGKFLHP
jgi:hypothetical protein